ncbi:uncharacterized protein LOC142527393 [Primulina tabacum]|uniref:uncharacterized protein LOC142527393 n=1 Tax=Primulina tabacum TaxID=48773 RepID=UPI003F5ACF4B
MEPYAEASCVLKVNVHCQACKMKMLEVLGSICGVFDVTIDSQEGLAKVYGVVNPNMLVRALTRTGYHAELKWVKLGHPDLNRRSYSHDYYDHGYYNTGYPYGVVLDDPYRNRLRYLMDQYSYSCSSRLRFDHPYYHGLSLPPREVRTIISTQRI